MSLFEIAREDATARIDGASDLFKTVVKSKDPKSIQRIKGLAFVDMYAAYEPSVLSSVSLYLTAVKDANLPVSRLQPGLQSLIKDPDLQSMTESKKVKWKRRSEMLAKLQSGLTGCAVVSVFPDDGSHYRMSQLHLIWDLLQLRGSVLPAKMLTPLIGEVVENRNAIAHGRERPETIGRRYTEVEIQEKLDQVKTICIHILTAAENGAISAVTAASV
ncbi:HEPN domain-containing protein [Rosistilla oblonga]|uniref:RiboL-PSP-HEPN domain-containing protein n=1 Tax=Rosistilla oblonga TaxID=2527990 RepID=A0A518J108_9BACT|nr:HEPN domain-containing protein [Rosistilla oblonga]QDV59012.1 hypothetical protein Mal33_50370 [Rosistilla oblonga]